MTIFYWTIGITYILGILSTISYTKRYKILGAFFVIIIAVILISVSGLRLDGGDTYFYKHSYRLLVEDPNSVDLSKDGLFNILSLILINFSTDPQILIFTTALITNLCNVLILNKYRSYVELQIYMYITSGYYFVSMNGIRQSLAAAFLFLCTKFIIQGKFKWYCLCVIIISGIHASALIMIPVYFIARQEAWSKKMIKFLIISIICVIFYQVLSPILFKLLQNTQYGSYSDFDQGGSSFIRTVINAVPVILSYLKRDTLKENSKLTNVLVNISIINLIFVSFSMFNWIFNRFTIYFQLYNFILVPYIIQNCFRGKEKRVIYIMFVICYFIFFFKEQVLGFNSQYKSDYLNWENILYNFKAN